MYIRLLAFLSSRQIRTVNMQPKHVRARVAVHWRRMTCRSLGKLQFTGNHVGTDTISTYFVNIYKRSRLKNVAGIFIINTLCFHIYIFVDTNNKITKLILGYLILSRTLTADWFKWMPGFRTPKCRPIRSIVITLHYISVCVLCVCVCACCALVDDNPATCDCLTNINNIALQLK